MTWAVAVVLVCALMLKLGSGDRDGSPAGSWSTGPDAKLAHQKMPDPEGPGGDEVCSDRDYANERC